MAETQGRRIKCNGQLDGDKHCNKTLAVVLDDGTVDFKRERSRIVTTGRDYAQLITCAWCSHKTALIIKDGKLDEHGLEFKSDEPPKPNDKPKEGDQDGGTTEEAGKAGEQERGAEAGAPAGGEGGEEPAGAAAGGTPDPDGKGAASDTGDGSEGGSGEPAEPDPEPKPAAKPKRKHLRKAAARG